MINVFISYRRDGGSEISRLIYSELNKYKNINPVLDVEHLHAGVFDEQIYQQIDDCNAFVLILSQNALDRCVYQNDWVRLELEYALKKEKTIIPVIAEGFVFPDNLPKSLKKVLKYEGVQYSHELYSGTTEKFVTLIQNTTSEDINYDPDEEIEKKKRIKKIIWITAGIIILVAIAIAATVLTTQKVSEFDETTTKVYFSKIMPYYQNEAGFYSSVKKTKDDNSNSFSGNKAFKILNFIRNDDENHSSIIEDLYCKIESLTIDYSPALIVSAGIGKNEGNRIKIFVANNGWGEIEDISVDLKVLDAANKEYDISDVIVEKKESVTTLKSGEVGVPLSCYIDKEKFDAMISRPDVQAYKDNRPELSQGLGLSINVKAKDLVNPVTPRSCVRFYYNSKTQAFELFKGGKGDSPIETTLFALLDVDEAPAELHFIGDKAFDNVDGTLKVGTVIAPTKSCCVQCKNVFTINGKRQETDSFIANITVPFYNDLFLDISQPITQTLSDLDSVQTGELTQTVQNMSGKVKYKYNPMEILPKEMQNALKEQYPQYQ